LTTTIMIFLLSTINLGINLQYAFANMGMTGWNSADGILIDLPESAALLIVDAVLIYRCWTVYGNSWRIVCLPITFWFCTIAGTILNVYYDHQMVVEMERGLDIVASGVRSADALIGLYASNIATNVFSTSAIIYKIVSVTNNSGRSKRFHNTVRILAESGIIYALMTVFALIGSILEATWDPNNCKGCLIMAISDVTNFSVAGITFNLILIRVNQDRARVTDTYADTGDVNKKEPISRLRFQTNLTTQTSTNVSTNLSNEHHYEDTVVERGEEA